MPPKPLFVRRPAPELRRCRERFCAPPMAIAQCGSVLVPSWFAALLLGGLRVPAPCARAKLGGPLQFAVEAARAADYALPLGSLAYAQVCGAASPPSCHRPRDLGRTSPSRRASLKCFARVSYGRCGVGPLRPGTGRPRPWRLLRAFSGPMLVDCRGMPEDAVTRTYSISPCAADLLCASSPSSCSRSH